MATKTIGATGDYTTIAAWSTYVKALSTLTANEIGQLIDNAVYTYGASTDLDLSSLTLSGFTVTLQGSGSGVHDGDFGNGARVEASASFGGLYNPRQIIVEDFSINNTEPSSGGARCFNTCVSATLKRVIAKVDSTGANSECFGLNNSSIAEACRAVGGTEGFELLHANAIANNCTSINSAIGLKANVANTATCKNNATYGCTTDWSGTWSGTYSNNASEDGTHPGTSGVTITANPFDADGYTPSSGGQLDGAGVDLSIALDAANNSYNATPSIGAYEVVGGGSPTGIPIFRRRIEGY